MPCAETRTLLTTPVPSPTGEELAVASVLSGEALVRKGTDVLGVPALVKFADYATASALTANTKSGTTVLTANSNGALAVDGAAPAAGKRVLVKDETDASKRGLYEVTSAGSGGAPWVLTRAWDAATAANLGRGQIVVVRGGTANVDKVFKLDSTVATPHTDNQTWTEYGASAGGLVLTADTGWSAPSLTPSKAGVAASTTHNQLLAIVAGLQTAFLASKIPQP